VGVRRPLRVFLRRLRPLHDPGLLHGQPPQGSLGLALPRQTWDLLLEPCCLLFVVSCFLLGDVSFNQVLAPSCVHRSAQQAGCAVVNLEQKKLQECLRDQDCPGQSLFSPHLLESLGRFSDGAMASIRDVAHGAFPGVQAARVHGYCFFNLSSQLAMVWCRHTCCMLTATTGLKLPIRDLAPGFSTSHQDAPSRHC
jgi:hypothetical protein